MNSFSRTTNNSYRDYRALRDAYNAQIQIIHWYLRATTEYPARAIAYYSGINLNNAANSNQPATPIIPVNDAQQTEQAADL